MESLRDIRRNIKSVRATQQITYTMKMVAAARVKKAQSAILSARPFASKLEEMVSSLAGLEAAAGGSTRMLLEPQEGPAGLILVTSDKGLCGSFNAWIFRAASAWLKRRGGSPVRAFAVGRKGRDFLRRLRFPGLQIVYESVGVFPNAGYVHAELLGRAVVSECLSGKLGGVTVIYNEFKSLLSQTLRERILVPVSAGKSAAAGPPAGFEPAPELLFDSLLPRHVKAQLYRILLESQAAELAARRNAMESASKNAGDIIGELTLRLNKTRQAMITQELTEIMGGAEALK